VALLPNYAIYILLVFGEYSVQPHRKPNQITNKNMWHIWIKNINHMKKLSVASVVCAVVAGIMGGNHASAQTLALQLQANNYNPTTGVWTDSSGNGNTATYSGSSIPTLVTGVTPNGSSAVDLTGAGSLVLNSSISGASGYTVFAFLEPLGGTGRNALTGGSSPTALEYDIYQHQADFLTEYTADVAHGNATLSGSAFSLIDLAVSSGGSSFNLNGSSDGTGAGASFGAPITRIGNNEGGGDGFDGQLAEIDIYSGVLTAPQIVAQEALLSAEYINPVPEPTTLALLAGGIGAIVATRRMRRN